MSKYGFDIAGDPPIHLGGFLRLNEKLSAFDITNKNQKL
jgi:hypothetical protein